MTNGKQSGQRIAASGAFASVMAVAASGVSFTYTQAVPYGSTFSRTSPQMTPADVALIDAKVDAKLAEHRGDLRLNTQGLADLKDRLNDLSSKMATVPSDVAAMKRDIAHLPTKDELGTKLRNYLAFAVGIAAILNAAISWGPKIFGH